MVVRQYQEELKYLEKINECCWRIKKGFQPNMKVYMYYLLFSIVYIENKDKIYIKKYMYKCHFMMQFREI